MYESITPWRSIVTAPFLKRGVFQGVIAWVFLGMSMVCSEAADWPQWRGPNRDGTSSDSSAFSVWPPVELWRVSLTPNASGFASPIVSEGRVYVMGGFASYPEAQDVMCCFDAVTGTSLWTNSWTSANSCGGGPGSTPVIHENELYAISHDGVLRCLDKITGTNLWSVSLSHITGDDNCASPLIEGDLVILNMGQSGVAVRRSAPHDVVWESAAGWPEYASPVACTIGDERLVAIMAQTNFVLVAPDDGRIVAGIPWPGALSVPDPIVFGNRFFISTGDGAGYCGVVEYTNGVLSTVWQNPNNVGLVTKAGNFVVIGDYVYGVECDGSADWGVFRCLDLRDGSEMWSTNAINLHDNMSTTIAVGDKVIFSTRWGGVLVAKATPTGFDMEGRSKISIDTAITPAYANGRLYIRDRNGWLVCLSVGTSASAGVVAFSATTYEVEKGQVFCT